MNSCFEPTFPEIWRESNWLERSLLVLFAAGIFFAVLVREDWYGALLGTVLTAWQFADMAHRIELARWRGLVEAKTDSTAGYDADGVVTFHPAMSVTFNTDGHVTGDIGEALRRAREIKKQRGMPDNGR